MNDLISRQAAIRSVCEKDCRMLKPCNAECGSIIALRELPSAERRGRWTNEHTMEHDGETYCDQCGWTWENLTFDRTKVKRSPYCPNCGAKMDEVEG